MDCILSKKKPQKNKEKHKREACKRYQNLSEEKKNKTRQYALEKYQNLSEEQKNWSENITVKNPKYKNPSKDEEQELVEYSWISHISLIEITSMLLNKFPVFTCKSRWEYSNPTTTWHS